MDKYLVGPDEVERQLEVAGNINTETKPTSAVVEQLSRRVPFDTGWLPPGLRSYTQSGNHAQIVIVAPPGVNRINWGRTEGDPECKQYLLAQPWRVIIADTIEGNLFGARMFYSPGPVNDIETPLYHQNVPNLNCRGYRGNGVGWVCLYHNENWDGWTLGQKMERIIERCSGSEAYNDANMDMTDGPRFYKDHGAPSYIYDPKEWEKRTEKKGVEWTFDSSLWIPVLVASPDNQDQHHENGEPLTLKMAMDGKYNAYYGDKYHPKASLEYRKGNQPFEPGMFRESYAKADGEPVLDKKKAKKDKVKKSVPAVALAEPDPVPLLPSEPVAQWANEEEDEFCCDCGVHIPEGTGGPAEHGPVCDGCLNNLQECPNCNIYFVELMAHPGGIACAECNPEFACFMCDGDFDGIHRHMINITPKDGVGVQENAELCPNCVDTHMLCNGCGKLRNATSDMYMTKDMQMLCYACTEVCTECSWLVSKDDEGHKADCDPAFLQQA